MLYMSLSSSWSGIIGRPPLCIWSYQCRACMISSRFTAHFACSRLLPLASRDRLYIENLFTTQGESSWVFPRTHVYRTCWTGIPQHQQHHENTRLEQRICVGT